MPYVQRDGSNNVTGLYQVLQAGYAEEFLADNDPAVIAYRNPPPTANQIRVAAIRADPAYVDLLNRARMACASDIDAWLAANVTTLAQARTVLAAIVKLLAASY
jgi:hypothetical protein